MADKQSGKSREGFGDGQGTRVGKPDEGRSDEDGRLGAEGSGKGAEGGVTRGADAVKGGKSTGAGAEAAEGMHALADGDADKSSGRAGSKAAGSEDEAGSEPLEGRNREHRSGYGGAGGAPVTSSDQREPQEPTGNAKQ